MDRTRYDSKEGIANRLTSLADLYAVAQERHVAGYERRERLRPFWVLGRYYFDEVGNSWLINRQVFTDQDRAQVLPVMERVEFDAAWQNAVQRLPQHLRVSWMTNPTEGQNGHEPVIPIPPPGMICCECRQGWDLLSCHDRYADGGLEGVSLDPYVGKTLTEIAVLLARGPETICNVLAGVTNGNYVKTVCDQLPEPLSADEQQRYDQAVAESSFPTRKTEYVTWEYVAQAGDEMSANVVRLYHGACYRKLVTARAEQTLEVNTEALRQMLDAVGFDDIKIQRAEVPQRILDLVVDMDGPSDAFAREAAIADLNRSSVYWRVATLQGSFGIWMAAYMALDFSATGVRYQELFPESGEESRDLFLCGLDQEVLALFRRFLRNRWQDRVQAS